MKTLPLSPLPFETSEESRSFRQMDIAGFVDEQVVSGVIARGAYDRTPAKPEGMVLSSGVDDYAGWAPHVESRAELPVQTPVALPVESPFRKMAERSALAPAPVREPSLPRPWGSLEVDVEKPYEGGQRWWLFGMAGAIICGLVAFSLTYFAQRPEISGITNAGAPAQEWQAAPAEAGNAPAIQPSLTTALPAAR